MMMIIIIFTIIITIEHQNWSLTFQPKIIEGFILTLPSPPPSTPPPPTFLRFAICFWTEYLGCKNSNVPNNCSAGWNIFSEEMQKKKAPTLNILR